MTHSSLSATEIRFQEIAQEIKFFYEQFGEAHLYLAYHAAFPIALTPHLLYRLWANFQTDVEGQDLKIPWIAVADLLLSPICREVGHELYEMEQSIRNQLLDELIDNPRFGRQQIDELARFLLAYVRQQLNSPKAAVRNFALAQHWTALAYIYPEAAARDLALQLTKLRLDEKTEWVRMASLAATLATPLKEAQFEPLLIYLQGMRYLARGNQKEAESKFETLPTNNNRIVVAGITLSIPEFKNSVWNISSVWVTPSSLKRVEFELVKLIPQPLLMGLGSKWITNRHLRQAEIFYEQLGEGIILEMVHLPKGEFQMGAFEKEGDYRERPQHLVTLASLFLSRFPITQAQWQTIAKQDKVRIDLNLEPSRFKGANLPVEQVTWFETIEFCERLQLQTGKPYRLPSEAEWEYACRAGTSTPFHFGAAISPKLANYDASQKFRSGPKGRSSKHTTEVGSFRAANAFGFDDLHGNVWEWCADHWYEDYTNAPADGSARVTNNRTSHRVIRGGSWLNGSSECRSAYRNGIPPENKVLTVGFRVAVSLSE